MQTVILRPDPPIHGPVTGPVTEIAIQRRPSNLRRKVVGQKMPPDSIRLGLNRSSIRLTMRLIVSSFILAMLLTVGFPSVSSAQTTASNCSTPRAAWTSLLYWLQPAQNRWNPKQAAICIDPEVLALGVRPAMAAVELKQWLDAKQAYVDLDAIPDTPGWRQPTTGNAKYWEPRAKQIPGSNVYIEKQNGRWIFPAAALESVGALRPSISTRIGNRLPSWSNTWLWGSALWKYLALLLAVLFAWMLGRITSTAISRGLHLLPTGNRVPLALARSIAQAKRALFGVLSGIFLYLSTLLLRFPLGHTKIFTLLAKIILAFSVTWLLYRIIDVVSSLWNEKAKLTETKLDDQLIPMATSVAKVAIVTISSAVLLQNAGFEVGTIVASLGIGGLAFALAAKDTLANFFGSLMIFIDKPYQLGDWVVIGDTEGEVEEVGFRTSRIRTVKDSLVTIPNAMITTTAIDNFGRRSYRIYRTTLGLTYDTPRDRIDAFCHGVRTIILEHPKLRHDNLIVEFTGFAASSLDVMVRCYAQASSYAEEMKIRSEINTSILQLAETLRISFAFPTTTIHAETVAEIGTSRPSYGELPAPADEIIGQSSPK